MADSFAGDRMAEGYAHCRPPVHPHILRRAASALEFLQPISAALDLGCGAGSSTRALRPYAPLLVAIDPVEAMVKAGSRIEPEAYFVAASADRIPVRNGSLDLIAAAGSLNYVDLDLFFSEADRVLSPHGGILAYDFSPGSSIAGTNGLDQWFESFITKYPWPPSSGVALAPEPIASVSPRFELHRAENFEIAIPLSRDFYVNYMLTETNVSHALNTGASLVDVEIWCSKTLAEFWDEGSADVIFRGYWVILRRAA